jgi:hypothetical protein
MLVAIYQTTRRHIPEDQDLESADASKHSPMKGVRGEAPNIHYFGQLHTLANLILGKQPLLSTGVPQSWSEHNEQKNPATPGIKPWSSSLLWVTLTTLISWFTKKSYWKAFLTRHLWTFLKVYSSPYSLAVIKYHHSCIVITEQRTWPIKMSKYPPWSSWLSQVRRNFLT